MILDPGMGQFMQKDIIDQFIRQMQQILVETDVVLGRTTAPSCLLPTDRDLSILEIVLGRQFPQSLVQDFTGIFPVDLR